MKKIEFDPQLSDLVKEINEAASISEMEAAPPSVPSSLDGLLRSAHAAGASDLLLVAQHRPTLRVAGRLRPIEFEEPLTAEQVKHLCFPLLDRRGREVLASEHAFDFAFGIEGLGRFRCNVHFQRKTPAAAIRLLPSHVPTLAELNLPADLASVVEPLAGLVLLTGPTGCGKSSTLAALIGILNQSSSSHIITIEDPIEFVYPMKAALVEHVEVGSDSLSFAAALRSALRQNPDVILVGEMRDLETMRMAITAGETGHLVLSTLHTRSAAQSIHRIVDVFPPEQQEQIRIQLAFSLRAVIAQQLIPTRDGRGRIPAAEVLIATPAVRNIIRQGDIRQLYHVQATQSQTGMRTFEHALADLVRDGRIKEEEAVRRCYHLEEFEKLL